MGNLPNGHSETQLLYERVGDPLVTPEDEPFFENPEELKNFYNKLGEARETQRKLAITEGRMDDPQVPKRLEDAITIQGTCPDMCPRYERYRRDVQANLMSWEALPPPHSKRLDHTKAVKIYERAVGDKTIPSDLRPEPVLQKTLNYLFRELLPKNGYHPTWAFIRDRTRAVRTDVGIQRLNTPGSREILTKCARYHILGLHYELKDPNVVLEEALLMNTLQSLKEMWHDSRNDASGSRGNIFQGELEMRLYHRLIHIRDQKERNDDVPEEIASFPAFKLITDFRLHVQKESAPITKKSTLKVGAEGMSLFSQVIASLSVNQHHPTEGMRTGSGTVFLIACILERLFGEGTVGQEQMLNLRGSLTDVDLIDAAGAHTSVAKPAADVIDTNGDGMEDFLSDDGDAGERKKDFPSSSGHAHDSTEGSAMLNPPSSDASKASAFGSFGQGAPSGATSAFNLGTSSSASGQSAFSFGNGGTTSSAFAPNPTNPFGGTGRSVFAQGGVPTSSIFATTSVFGRRDDAPKSVFGNSSDTTTAGPPKLSTPISSKVEPVSTTPAYTPAASSSFSAASKQPETQIVGSEKSALRSQPTPSLNPQAKAFVPFAVPAKLTETSIFSSQKLPKNGPATPASTPELGEPSQSPHVPPTQPASAPPAIVPTNLGPFKPPPLPAGLFSTTPTVPPFGAVSSSPAAPAPPPTSTSLPKINTQVNASSSMPFQESPMIPSAPKPHTISLPATPLLEEQAGNVMPPPSRPMNLFAPSNPSPLRSGQASGQPSFVSPTPTPRKARALLKGALVGKLDVANLPFTDPKDSEAEMLSPLVINTPSVSRMPSLENFQNGLGLVNAVSGSPIGDKSKLKGALSAPSSSSLKPWEDKRAVEEGIKGKDSEDKEDGLRKEKLIALADAFVTEKWMRRWVKKATDRAAWLAAVDRSQRYREQLIENASSSLTRSGRSVRRRSPEISETNKRRRVISDAGSESEFGGGSEWSGGSVSKRRKRRTSGKYEPPRTDEELARRLVEKHKENTIRWTPNSFLDHIKLRERTYTREQRASRLLPGNRAPWTLWVCCNPENDGTAIWVEKKFGVSKGDDEAQEGKWVTNAICEVSVSEELERTNQSPCPGLLVFELSPLEGVDDELERKYRVLDDCSRLRDMICSLPTRRQYLPSLLVLHWPSSNASSIGHDFRDTVKAYVEKGTLSNYAFFDCNAPAFDLDPTFKSIVSQLGLDFEGKLARKLSFRTVPDLFKPSLQQFADEWITVCNSRTPTFNWELYSRLVSAFITVLQRCGRIVSLFFDGEVGDLLPNSLDFSSCKDDDDAYSIALGWLSSLGHHPTEFATAEIEGHRDLGEPFPSRPLLEHLRELLFTSAERTMSSNWSGPSFLVLSQDVQSGLEEIQQAVIERHAELSRSYTLMARRSPKRLASSLVSSGSSASPPHRGSKRLRLSNNSTSEPDGTISSFLTPAASPSPDEALDESAMQIEELGGSSAASQSLSDAPSSMKGKVTISMLRELTKSMKDRYRPNGS